MVDDIFFAWFKVTKWLNALENGVLVIMMTCHVCRGAAAVTTRVTTTEDRSGDPETETERIVETGGRGTEGAGTSLTPGPAGSGVRALRESRHLKKIKGMRRGRGPAVTERGGQREETRGGLSGDLRRDLRRIGGQLTEPSGRGETRGRWRRDGNGTKCEKWTSGGGKRRNDSRRLKGGRQRFVEKKRN